MSEIKKETELSRRDFLKIVGSLLKGVAIGGSITTGLGSLIIQYMESEAEKNNIINTNELLTNEQVVLLNEIGEYRDALALRGLPEHLTVLKLEEASKTSWNSDLEEINVDISNAHKSHAQQAIKILEIMFGINAKHLVKNIESDTNFRANGTFNGENRTMTLDTIDDPTLLLFLFVSAHEITHATDPSLSTNPIYPLDTLIRVSHGMARVLSQSTKIDNMFMNNPDSYNIPNIKKRIGEGIGRLFLENATLIDQIDFMGHELIISTLKSISKRQGVTLSQIKFTKKACLSLGEALLPQILDKSISISGSLLNDWYIPRVEFASKEIFADMVSTALIKPEKINDNKEILLGIAEILSAIQGKQVDIEDIIKELHFSDDEIKARFEIEQALTEETNSETPKSVDKQTNEEEILMLSTEDIQTIQGEATKEKRRQDEFWDFINEGVISESMKEYPPNMKTTMKRYAQAISTTYHQFPKIIYGLDADDISFDLNLHIWETWDIAEAWNANVFSNLLIDPSLIPNNLKDIERRIGILESFIKSPAFQCSTEKLSEPIQTRYTSHLNSIRTRAKHILS